MKITITAESREDEAALGQRVVEYRWVDTAVVMAKCLEGGVELKTYGHSFGPDIPWLIGRCGRTKEWLEDYLAKAAG